MKFLRQYGDFVLTDGISPTPRLQVIPKTGCRLDCYRDNQGGRWPVIIISASKEVLFELFMDLIGLFGRRMVDVALETSHNTEAMKHDDLFTEDTDITVLKSTLWDFEELLVNDGCAGIAVMDVKNLFEIQLNEHKNIVIYNWPLVKKKLRRILKRYGIKKDANIKFISEGEHIHASCDDFERQFEKLKQVLGAEDA